MVVGNKVEALVLILQREMLSHRPEKVAYVKAS
jgi:hypothetical protein